MKKVYEVYDHEAAMEPVFPANARELRESSARLVQSSAKLGGALHPLTRQKVVELVRQMNSYYSNLIEGHNTNPAEIEKALRKDYSRDPAKRALQQESSAHIEVQHLIEDRLSQEDVAICSAAFLCWIHKEFYERLPDEFRIVRTKSGKKERVEPGKLRTCEVEVGRHVAPTFRKLGKFLERFEAAYQPSIQDPLDRIIAAAAAHHRLAWIHPFLDGNGRVLRLFTHAYFIKIGLEGHGLWTISRGLARGRDEYIAALAGADRRRENDFDGRGNLSAQGLDEFCTFFLDVGIDQIEFMSGLLDLDTVLKRISTYAERWAIEMGVPIESKHVLTEVFLRGEISRGDAGRVTGKPARTARRILGPLLKAGLIVSDTSKGPIRIGLPTKCVGYYFPRLYPEGVELDSESSR
jgi:Fic family protein